MDTFTVLNDIIDANPDLSYLHVKEFSNRQLLQDRLDLSHEEKHDIATALQEREKMRLPFWDCLLLQYLQSNRYSKRLVSDAQFHNSFCSDFAFQRDNLIKVSELVSANPSRKFVVSSKVALACGSIKHIPMLDFHIPMRDVFPDIIIDILQLLGEYSGYVLASGESYHFYGTRLLEEKELITFLARALRMSPIIDRAWVSHQLEEGSCALRLGEKNGFFPRIVRKLHE